MKQVEKGVLEPSVMRREAGGYLSVRGNRMLLITAAVVVLSTVVLYAVLFGVYSAITVSLASQSLASDHTAYLLSQSLPAVCALTVFLLTLLLTLPLAYGLFHLASRIVAEEDATFADLFHSFSSSASYGRALCLAFATLWRFAVVAGIVGLTYRAAIELSQGSVLIGFLGVIAIMCEIALALILSAKGFFTAYLAYTREDFSISQARNVSKSLTRACRSAVFRYVIDYLPWLILSFATAGILLVADTLPRMLISYFRFSEAIYKRFYQSEEIKDHE